MLNKLVLIIEQFKIGRIIMLKEKLTLDEYNELGEFSVNQIDKYKSGEIDIYTLVATITLNAFNKGCQSAEV